MTINVHNLGQAIIGLERLWQRLSEIDTATGRKRTPGREFQIENGDPLDCWDATQLRLAEEVGIDLVAIGDAVRERIDAKLAKWN